MPLSVRILSKDDYQTLERWWVEWGWIPPPRDFLPLDGLCGGMVESDGQPVVAGFMYTTNAKVAWIDWVVSDRSYRNDDRSEAINLLLAFLEKLARQTDAKYLYALLKHKGLQESYEALGYVKGDAYNTEMIKWLGSPQ
jgi:hypothetical protein